MAPTSIPRILVTWTVVASAMGTVAALAVHQIDRRRAHSASAEAKGTVNAITRAAVAAYEREPYWGCLGCSGPVHVLCERATPVPLDFVRVQGARYLPSAAPGTDYHTGSSTEGWECLKFWLDTPARYRYHYERGGGWVVPGMAPGPDGFEAAAQGDLDGDGRRSTFSRTGEVRGGVVVLATEMFVDQELE